MKIVQLLPGSGSRFYCENCSRDGNLVSGLRQRGHQITVAPLYLPPDIEDPASDGIPIFYGAVGMYLNHLLPGKRSIPTFIGRILDSPALLKLAGSLSGSTRAAELGELTVSMLKGEQGEQAAELDRLIQWLAIERPDLVHLSNGLLLGVAPRIRRELGIAVVCSLQDEHTWVSQLGSCEKTTWDLMKQQARAVDLFLPVSSHHAHLMAAKAGIPEDQMRVIPVGVPVKHYRRSRLPNDPPQLGFLGRMCPEMGFDILARAFILLKRTVEMRSLTLSLTGGYTGAESKFVKATLGLIQNEGFIQDVTMESGFDLAGRVSFLSELSVLAVPAVDQVAFGTAAVEAMAAGVPVALPRVGGYTELLETTGAGVLYEPNTPEVLAQTLHDMISDENEMKRLGEAGHRSASQHFTMETMVTQVERAYQECLS